MAKILSRINKGSVQAMTETLKSGSEKRTETVPGPPTTLTGHRY